MKHRRHALKKERIVPEIGILQLLRLRQSDRALAEAFEHQIVKPGMLDAEFDRGLDSVSGIARSSPYPDDFLHDPLFVPAPGDDAWRLLLMVGAVIL